MTNTDLFTSARLGALELPNRLVMAPLTRNRAEADGTPSELMRIMYTQRATAGLIIAEGTTPNPVGQTYPNIPGIHTDSHIAGWRRVTDSVRAAGGRMFLQLQHGGRVGHPDNSGLVPVAPSPIPLPEGIHTPSGHQESAIPRELSPAEIQETIADFATAARNAVAAGFEGVEIHSANGHLLHQFLAGNTNRRTDVYGGPIAHRIRFTLEVVDAVIAAIGAQRVGIRIAPGVTTNGIAEDDTDELYPALVTAFAERHPAYLHIVFADPETALFQRIRQLWPHTLIANPNLGRGELPADGGKAAAEALLTAGADLVSLGRAFLANPDLVKRLRLGAPLNPLSDAPLMYVGGPEGYIDYPTLQTVAA
ncbi:alkene reductase [Nocardia sp. CDC160]|uniref:alkene reductase n=1 Tax=Nocardia sp. CDC160 TaxID=3112166 RepID=UPI002DBB02E1|nr:alkene reductase [Nocardia sp. CDC160]MEC3914701.1 alkene reductase [Nocardia sp. CDC160]